MYNKRIKAISKRQGTSPKKAEDLAQRYYGTSDLSKLQAYQLEKITTWITNTTPTKGSNQDRKAGRSAGRYAKNRT